MSTDLAWLLDGDPALRWQVLRDLAGAAPGEVSAERARVAREGLGARLIALQASDGRWGGAAWNRGWTSTMHALMLLLHEFLKKRLSQMQEKGVRLHAIGDLSRLPKRTQKLLQSSLEATAGNTRLNLVLALSYGSRAETAAAARKIAETASRGELHPDAVTEDLFNQHLDTAGMPEPDLLIRTSGEMRVSNFLLWQISYAELYVTETLWPDFSDRDMEAALLDYSRRKRRFGAL